MKGWIALLLTAVLLCQLEPVYAVLHQNLPWLPETPPIELPQFYLTREDAVRSQEENDGNSGPEEDQPVMAEPSPEDEWALLLVNADHPIDREFCPVNPIRPMLGLWTTFGPCWKRPGRMGSIC